MAYYRSQGSARHRTRDIDGSHMGTATLLITPERLGKIMETKGVNSGKPREESVATPIPFLGSASGVAGSQCVFSCKAKQVINPISGIARCHNDIGGNLIRRVRA